VPVDTPFRRRSIRKIIAITALILSAVCLAQSQVAGDWKGVLNIGTRQLHIILHITNSDGNLKATMDSVDQNAFGLPVSSISLKNSELKFEVDKVGGSYVGQLSPDATKISGSSSQGGASLDLDFRRATDAVKAQPNLPRLPILMVPGWVRSRPAASGCGPCSTSSIRWMA
jgi:hypothetical protein